MESYQTLKKIVRDSFFGVLFGGAVTLGGAACASISDQYHQPPISSSSGGSGGGSGKSYNPADFIPNPEVEALLSSPQDLEKTLMKKKECDLAHLDRFEREKWELLACEEEIGPNRYRPAWRINLTGTCGVYVKERYQRGFFKPVDWFTDDDVVISDSLGQVFPIRLGDETARALANVITLYAEENKKKDLCKRAVQYVAENYAPARPLTYAEKHQAKELLAFRKSDRNRNQFASSQAEKGIQAESSSGYIVYKDEKGNIIQRGETVVLLER